MLCRLCVFIGAGERYNKMEMIVRYLTGRLRYCHCLPAPLRLAPNVSGRRQSRTEGCEREWWQGRMSQSDLSNSSPAPPPGYREGPHPVISGESWVTLETPALSWLFQSSRSPVLIDHFPLRLRDLSLHVLRVLLVRWNANRNILLLLWARGKGEKEKNLRQICLSLPWWSSRH